MTRPADVPRLSDPGELAAALPLLLGFPPQESLVVVFLQGPRSRIGLTARYDLPPPDAVEPVVRDLARRARGRQRACALVCTDASGPRPHTALVASLADLPVDLVDVLLVRGGRWWSYRCTGAGCCPPEGTPLPGTTPALTRVRAEQVVRGRAVLPSRAALVRALAPPDPSPELVGLCRQTSLRLADEVVEQGRAAVRGRLLASAAGALRRDDPLGDGEAVELALALHDVLVRDEVLTWSLRREEALLTLLLAVAARVPPPYDAPVAACLAWVSLCRGDGAAAGVALERALASDPEHGLALLLRTALDQQVPPRRLRAVATRSAVELRRRR